ncbi:glycosyltransferase [Paenibacillus sonchi]|uniref:glycosyltransferase n=1 Tax=Paenibacillus sonchi TaxID=373687 RepID=UPI001E4ECDFA|nr:glycosyltransferase [Paenibacillus sonchi]MCE3202786.1 glycosyltransferase [Paenibacillus sonchi]
MRERMLFLSAQKECSKEEEHRTESFLEILLEKFDIDLIEFRQGGRERAADSGYTLTVHRLEQAAAPRSALLRPLDKLRSIAAFEDISKDLRTEIRRLCSRHTYSHVFISHRFLNNCIDMISSLLPEAVIITDARRTWSRAAEKGGTVRRRIKYPYHKLNEARTRRDERRLMNKTGLLLTANERDALSFKALSFADAGKVHVVPPFVDLQQYQHDEPVCKENGIMLHWDIHNVQGRNAALLFHAKVYPLIRAEVPEVQCYMVGSAADSSIQALSKTDSSVKIIEDTSLAGEYIRRAKAVIACLDEGCGGQKKILEAWALRTPVVASPRGVEALICENGRDILLAGTAREIAEQTVMLLQTPELASLISDRAYRTLLNHYEVKNVKAKVLSLV